MTNKSSIFSISKRLFLTIFLAAFFLTLQPIDDPDFGWHLKTGEYIWQTKQIPQTDMFSFSVPNHPYIAHSWLTDIIVYLTHQAKPLWGPTFFYTTIYAIGVSFQFATAKKLTKNHLLSSAILFVAPISVLFLGLRTQALSFLGLSVVFYLLISSKPSDTNSSRVSYLHWLRTSKLWLLIPIFVIWANLHAGFVIGLGFIGLWTSILFLKNIYKKKKIHFSSSTKFLTTTLSFSAISTLANPYSLRLHKFIFAMLTNSSIRQINTDWLPLFSANLPQQTIFPRLMLFILASTLILFCKNSTLRMLVTFFLALSLSSIRFTLPLLILIAPTTTVLLAEILDSRFDRAKGGFTRTVIALATAPLIFLAISNFQRASSTYQSVESYAKYTNFPYPAVSYIKHNQPSGSIFNHPNWGGYLIWQLPEHKIFIDGRMDNFFINGTSVLEEFASVERLETGWSEKLHRHNPDLVLIPAGWDLAQNLINSANWEILFRDERSVVLSKVNNI